MLFKKYFAVALSVLVLTINLGVLNGSEKELNNELDAGFEIQIMAAESKSKYNALNEFREDQIKDLKKENAYLKLGYFLIIIKLASML